MTPPELSLQQGQPELALTQLQELVKKDPGNSKLRVFLFQLLSLLGQWDRALAQLKVAGDLDKSNLLMVQTYREAILCEAFRVEVFSGKRTPLVFGEPQHWLALIVEALRLDAQQQYELAQKHRDEAFNLAETTSGIINSASFQWIADADSRLGPVLEAVLNGRYYWIPFTQIQKVELEEPVDLRDLIWMPAVFTWINGGQATGLIPTRYPKTEECSDPLLKMSRRTEWIEFQPGSFFGLGQRVFTTDNEDYDLMQVRTIEFAAREA